mgnify:CR=1 FL=1
MKKRMVLLSALVLCGCMLIGAEPQMPHRKRSLRSRQLRISTKPTRRGYQLSGISDMENLAN